MIPPVMIWFLLAGKSVVTIVQDPPVLNITVGQSAVMSCKVTEAGSLHIKYYYYWYLNNTNCKLENSTRITIVSNSITISSVTTDDIGIYICIVQNSQLHSDQGNGTHLLVQESTDPDPQNHYQHPYLYCLLLFIPLLLILFIYWIFRLSTTAGSQTHGPKWRWKKKDGDTELNYSAIVPQPNGAERMEQMKTMDRREGVDYAPVKIAVASLSLPYTSETSSMDNVLYATLKTEDS